MRFQIYSWVYSTYLLSHKLFPLYADTYPITHFGMKNGPVDEKYESKF